VVKDHFGASVKKCKGWLLFESGLSLIQVLNCPYLKVTFRANVSLRLDDVKNTPKKILVEKVNNEINIRANPGLTPVVIWTTDPLGVLHNDCSEFIRKYRINRQML